MAKASSAGQRGRLAPRSSKPLVSYGKNRYLLIDTANECQCVSGHVMERSHRTKLQHVACSSGCLWSCGFSPQQTQLLADPMYPGLGTTDTGAVRKSFCTWMSEAGGVNLLRDAQDLRELCGAHSERIDFCLFNTECY